MVAEVGKDIEKRITAIIIFLFLKISSLKSKVPEMKKIITNLIIMMSLFKPLSHHVTLL